MILSDHSQRWTFTIAKSINNRWDDDEDLPHGLEDWRDTTLECGIYFVMNETDNWFQWGQSMTTIAPLTSYYPMAGIPQSDNTNYFVASAVSSCFISVGHYLNLHEVCVRTKRRWQLLYQQLVRPRQEVP